MRRREPGAARSPRPTYEAEGVREHLGVIEGEVLRIRKRDPSCLGRVIASLRPDRAPPEEEDDRGHRLAGVPVRAGVDADDRARMSRKPGLLAHFADRGLLDPLLRVHEAPRKRPGTAERRAAATHQEDAAAGDPDRVGREARSPPPPRHASARPGRR